MIIKYVIVVNAWFTH